MTSHNVLVLATGNDSSARVLLRRCEDDGARERWWVTLLGDTQLRVEHALSLTRADLCLFLLDEQAPQSGRDRGAGRDRGFYLRKVSQGSGHPMASSDGAMSPEDLLHTLATLGRNAREPQCYALMLDSAALGDNGLEQAQALLADLLEHPQAEHWNSRLG